MLRILKIIAGNVTSEPATVALPGSVPTPDMFRGGVVFDHTKCIGCGMCAYVCASNAITGTDKGNAYAWAYEPGRCTFCARCLERCPGKALSMESVPVEAYEQPGERGVSKLVEFDPCPNCGDPVRKPVKHLLEQAFDHITDETRELVHLCERCRRRRLQRKMFAPAIGEKEKIK